MRAHLRRVLCCSWGQHKHGPRVARALGMIAVRFERADQAMKILQDCNSTRVTRHD